MKARGIIILLELRQWGLVRRKGSHRAFKHPLKPMIVTVPGHLGDEIPIGTLKSILNKAEVEKP